MTEISENGSLEELLEIGRTYTGNEAAGEDPDGIPTAVLDIAEETHEDSAEYALVDMTENKARRLDRPFFVAGCTDECDIVIPQDPENHTVSRVHCKISQRDGRVFLADCSRNGTFIGELGMEQSSFFRIPEGLEAELLPWHVVSFADRRFLLARLEK